MTQLNYTWQVEWSTLLDSRLADKCLNYLPLPILSLTDLKKLLLLLWVGPFRGVPFRDV